MLLEDVWNLKEIPLLSKLEKLDLQSNDRIT